MRLSTKMYHLLLVVVAVCGIFMVKPAEAALPQSMWGKTPKVAVLPIINVANDNPAVAQLALEKTIATFRYPEYELVSDDILLPVLTKVNYYEAAKKGPDKAMLETIRRETGTDMVVMIFVEKMSQQTIVGTETVEEMKILAKATSVYSWKKPLELRDDRIELLDSTVAGENGVLDVWKRVLNGFMKELQKK